MQCLAKSREDRPASAQQLYQQLSQCRSAESWSPLDAVQWWLQREEQANHPSPDRFEKRNLEPACST